MAINIRTNKNKHDGHGGIINSNTGISGTTYSFQVGDFLSLKDRLKKLYI